MKINPVASMLVICFALAPAVYARLYKVADYGAINDGATLNTKAIQKAIDDCTKNGGGTVLISGGGTYVTGTLYLKSNVTLHVDNGTVLQGSPQYQDYTTDTHKIMYKRESHMDRCLIFAKDAESIAIEGYGTIDGNGHEANFKQTGRPMLLRFLNCSRIHMRDIRLINSASWTSAWLYCQDVTVTGVTIISRVNKNGDGLDFDGCTDVRVSNCNFDNSDDCICLQASRPDKPCRNVVVTNCLFCTKWGGMRIGLLSRGNIEFVTVSNCVFRDIEDSGLKIQQNEGGEMRNMTFTNLVMENVPRPIFMTFCTQRACVDTPEGTFEPLKRMHNMMFSNIIVDNSKGDKNSAFFLTGMPDHLIENICIKDVQFIVAGGGTQADADKREIKEFTLEVLNKHWPEFYLVGTLPAYGLYARHMDGLTLENISIETKQPDSRAPVILNHVKNAKVRGIKANGQWLLDTEIVRQ
ncbi:glycoside hydrolase family 28 protein [Planctomycetota bacterium]